MSKEIWDILIIGCGASGLMAAISAKETDINAKVLIVEREKKPGKKLSATGNGKCNLSNKNCDEKFYYSDNSGFAGKVLSKFDEEETLTYFEKIGMPLREDREGRRYPHTEQAETVIKCLLYQVKKTGVFIFCDKRIDKIEKKDVFCLTEQNGEKYYAENVIVSAGGKAGLPSEMNFPAYDIAKDLGHEVNALKPVLTRFPVNTNWIKDLKGVRCKGKAALLINGNIVAEEEGEIQFTEKEISGIAIFNLSRYVQNEKNKHQILLDLYPDRTVEDLNKIISVSQKKTELLDGLLPSKLARHFNRYDKSDLAYKIKNWLIDVEIPDDISKAQLTGGGVSCKQINPETMESLLQKGLYFTGEILDVDGESGGRNLQWAWSSGRLAGKSAALSHLTKRL